MILKVLLAIKMLKKIRPLSIFLPKMSDIQEIFIKLNLCLFLIKDEKVLEKYNEIWKKVTNISKKEFDKKPAYNQKYIYKKISL